MSHITRRDYHTMRERVVAGRQGVYDRSLVTGGNVGVPPACRRDACASTLPLTKDLSYTPSSTARAVSLGTVESIDHAACRGGEIVAHNQFVHYDYGDCLAGESCNRWVSRMAGGQGGRQSDDELLIACACG